MRRDLLPTGVTYYKANMHMHTTVSDGKMTPEETKALYKSAGYSIVAFTDHEVIAPQNELTDEEFLAITSYELSVNPDGVSLPYEYVHTYHLNLFAKDPNQVMSRVFSADRVGREQSKPYIPEAMKDQICHHDYSQASINEIIRKSNEDGFLVSYNHPVWSQQNYTDYGELRGLWGVELYNSGCVRSGFYDTPQPLDDLLRQGEHLFPLATDDAHCVDDCCKGWLMVGAEKLEYKTVMDALEVGDFYASTGPEIKELFIEDGILTVRTSPVQSIVLSSDRRFNRLQKGSADAPVEEARFDLTPYLTNSALTDDPHYIRLTVRDAEGNQAWSRAYFIDEFK